MHKVLLVSGLALLLTACDEGGPKVPGRMAPPEAPVEINPPVRPADFAVKPCGRNETAPCLLVLAGGKRLLFGAPAGVGNEIPRDELAKLDGLFLFSLRPEEVEGLDEVRNLSWQAGRPQTLDVTGPTGTSGLIDGLNRAYEVSDALIFVEDGAPAGGFDAALLDTALEVTRQVQVFDTGDLTVEAVAGMNDRVSYRIVYRDINENWHALFLQPCGAPDMAAGEMEIGEVDQTRIACTDGAYGDDWPFAHTRFLFRSGG
ncbi:hypothetical protein [Henriciella marina]|uniref:hypothetical protein n=1 Tax=Henriciella marina TaxID=453851 RepID=UPI000372AFFA|nr:hypothetical protein [Henriciella marina]